MRCISTKVCGPSGSGCCGEALLSRAQLQVQRAHICAVVKLALAAGTQALPRLAHGIDAGGAEGVAALDHAVLLPAAVADLAVQALAHVLHLPGLRAAAARQPARAAHRQLGNLCLRRSASRDGFIAISWAVRPEGRQSSVRQVAGAADTCCKPIGRPICVHEGSYPVMRGGQQCCPCLLSRGHLPPTGI